MKKNDTLTWGIGIALLLLLWRTSKDQGGSGGSEDPGPVPPIKVPPGPGGVLTIEPTPGPIVPIKEPYPVHGGSGTEILVEVAEDPATPDPPIKMPVTDYSNEDIKTW